MCVCAVHSILYVYLSMFTCPGDNGYRLQAVSDVGQNGSLPGQLSDDVMLSRYDQRLEEDFT